MADDVAESTPEAIADAFSAITVSPQTPAAVVAVFSTYELIENILMRVSLEEILTAAATFDTFCLVVERSKLILKRFYTRDGGFKEGYESRENRDPIDFACNTWWRPCEDSIWSKNPEFSFRRTIDASKPFCPGRQLRMFLTRRGDSEAIGILDCTRDSARLVVASEASIAVKFRRTTRRKWILSASDVQSGEVFETCLEPGRRPLDIDAALYYYLVRFHGEPNKVLPEWDFDSKFLDAVLPSASGEDMFQSLHGRWVRPD